MKDQTMTLGNERQLRVGWVATAFWIVLAMLVVAGDWILYFIFWNLPLLILGVCLTIGSLIVLAFVAGRARHEPRQAESDDDSYQRFA